MPLPRNRPHHRHFSRRRNNTPVGRSARPRSLVIARADRAGDTDVRSATNRSDANYGRHRPNSTATSSWSTFLRQHGLSLSRSCRESTLGVTLPLSRKCAPPSGGDPPRPRPSNCIPVRLIAWHRPSSTTICSALLCRAPVSGNPEARRAAPKKACRLPRCPIQVFHTACTSCSRYQAVSNARFAPSGRRGLATVRKDRGRSLRRGGNHLESVGAGQAPW